MNTGEEETLFPAMPDIANKSDSSTLLQSKSVKKRDGSEIFNEYVYGYSELGAAATPFINVFNPSRQHVGHQYKLYYNSTPTPTSTPTLDSSTKEFEFDQHQHEYNKFRKLKVRKQKRESRIPKNVLCEFKSEDISGHKFEDLDSVLQSLGEGEEKKGKVKKKKADKRKGRRSVKKEVISGKEYPEETIEAKETKEEGLDLSEVEGITSNIGSLGSNEG